jgi:hypothetical protein
MEELSMMGISRKYLPVLGFAAALLASACGGDSGSNTSNQNSSQTGSGGSSSSSGPSSCAPTKCPKDVEYSLYSQQFCDDVENGSCAAQWKARVQCALANETCTAAGIQDRAKVKAACQAQIDALNMCDPTLGGS